MLRATNNFLSKSEKQYNAVTFLLRTVCLSLQFMLSHLLVTPYQSICSKKKKKETNFSRILLSTKYICIIQFQVMAKIYKFHRNRIQISILFRNQDAYFNLYIVSGLCSHLYCITLLFDLRGAVNSFSCKFPLLLSSQVEGVIPIQSSAPSQLTLYLFQILFST